MSSSSSSPPLEDAQLQAVASDALRDQERRDAAARARAAADAQMAEYIDSFAAFFVSLEAMRKTRMETMRNDEKARDHMNQFSLLMWNYLTFMCKENGLDSAEVLDRAKHAATLGVNLAPVFDYIQRQNIQLLDLNSGQITFDPTSRRGIEQYVLTQVYRITQTTPPPSQK